MNGLADPLGLSGGPVSLGTTGQISPTPLPGMSSIMEWLHHHHQDERDDEDGGADSPCSPPLSVTPVQQHLNQQQQDGLSGSTAGHHHLVQLNNKTSPSSSSVSNSSPSNGGNEGGRNELEEINTKELAARISAELKRCQIPQSIFAQRVLCRSQGTLSDLLRNPKPWSKLKSGRETFRRMSKWLQEPEFQRISALSITGESPMSYYILLSFEF